LHEEWVVQELLNEWLERISIFLGWSLGIQSKILELIEEVRKVDVLTNVIELLFELVDKLFNHFRIIQHVEESKGIGGGVIVVTLRRGILGGRRRSRSIGSKIDK